MKTLILSPHTDDAIFSLGDLISDMQDVTILSVFAGIPTDEGGWKKHTTLHAEHEKACKIIGAKHLELSFLDDVYERTKDVDLLHTIKPLLEGFDTIFIPLGIHHPDHIQLRELFLVHDLPYHFFYRELPYGVLYPDLVKNLEESNPLRKMPNTISSRKKLEAIMAYRSQIQSDHILKELSVPEVIYQKI